MPLKIDDWLARAAECDLQAASAVTPALKAEFLQMAKQWRELANDGITINGIRQGLRRDEGP